MFEVLIDVTNEKIRKLPVGTLGKSEMHLTTNWVSTRPRLAVLFLWGKFQAVYCMNDKAIAPIVISVSSYLGSAMFYIVPFIHTPRIYSTPISNNFGNIQISQNTSFFTIISICYIFKAASTITQYKKGCIFLNINDLHRHRK